MKFVADISKKTWKIIKEEKDSCETLNLLICFRDDETLPVHFNNLYFGFTIIDKEKETEVDSKIFDFNFVKQTDQDFLVSEIFEQLVPDKDYEIDIWAKNNDEKWSDTFTFLLPKPEKPYESWTWNSEDKIWEPPVPMPFALDVNWDEEKKEWVENTQ